MTDKNLPPRLPLPATQLQGDDSLLTLLGTFRPGLSRLASQHRLEIEEVLSEGAIAFYEAEIGFDPGRGDFSRRWWFLLLKRLPKLHPRKSDALAHVDFSMHWCDVVEDE